MGRMRMRFLVIKASRLIHENSFIPQMTNFRGKRCDLFRLCFVRQTAAFEVDTSVIKSTRHQLKTAAMLRFNNSTPIVWVRCFCASRLLHIVLCASDWDSKGWFTRTTQAQAQAQATCEPGRHKHKRAFLFLALVLASSRFTRGLCLCLCLCLRRTCKPAFTPIAK